MRRWTMTLILSAAALAAVAVAPRLAARWSTQGSQAPVVPVLSPDALGQGVPFAMQPRPVPDVATPVTIPEVGEPASAPVVPPVPDNFWIDAVDCGMG